MRYFSLLSINTKNSLFVILIASLFAVLTACEQGQSTTEPYHQQVQVEFLQQEDSYQIERFFVGQIEARQRVELGFELAGTIVDVMVDEGEVVEAGQLLARLDDQLLVAEIEQIEAQREDLRAQLTLADLEIKRQRNLINQGFASEQRVDELTAKIASLNARIKRQKALLASAQARITKQYLKAPYHAEISRRYNENGGIAVPGTAIFQLLEQGITEARVGVPARLAANLSVGAAVDVIVDKKMLSATVLTIGANVDAVTRTTPVRLSLPLDEVFIDGEMLYLRLPENINEAGFWVPGTALGSDVRGIWNLYAAVTTEQGELHQIEARSIELLHMANGKAFVKGAVTSNEKIISAGLHRVVPGLLVRVNGE